jgi:peptidyl-dipeptidase Dcp
LLSLAVSGLVLSACADQSPKQEAPAPAPAATAPVARANPLMTASPLQYQYPPFDKIQDGDYAPAFDAGMAEQRKEIDAIANDPAAPTFDNTIVAMERSGQLLTRVSTIFTNIISANTNDTLDKEQSDVSPKLQAHQDAINLDPKLFARVNTLYQNRASLNLDPESAQLLDRYYKQFVRAGAKLSDADKAKLKQYNTDLANLTTQFQQNVLKGTKEGAVVVDSVAELDGMSPEQISAAAEAAKARKLDGKYVITLQNTTIQPAEAHLKNRALRERIYKASIGRCQGGDADTTAIVAKTAKIRAEEAALLGYKNHAAYQLEDETAATPEAVNRMLGQLGVAGLNQAHKEAAEIQKLIDDQAKADHTKPFKLQPWDWAFYAEQVRKAHYSFDQSEVKPYFEMNHVLQDGVFYAAHQLYGISFKERHDLPVYHPDVRVFEVFEADGTSLGLFFADYFKRDSKQGGAWMNFYVAQTSLLDQKSVVSNNLNIAKPADGQPVLLSFDEVTTMFHEFGHALHGLFQNVKYPTLSNTPPDWVEFPSQFNEMWAREPSVLMHYAVNYQTGQPMPKDLFDKVIAAQKYGTGYSTTEYLAAAMLDQSWAQITADQAPSADKVMAFEEAALEKDGMDYGPVPPRYHTPYFSHVWYLGYSAGYYGYIWSEVLARDSGHWFHTHGGISRANGDYFRAKVLSQGRIQEPGQLFEQFYGGQPEVGPLLEYKGLTMPSSSSMKKAGDKK